MAISSPLQSKVPTGSTQTIKKLQTILLNRTKVRREIFQQQTILQNRRIENERRKQREDELEAPNLVTKPRGAAGLIAGSAKGFFERLVGFLSYLTAGWIINNLPTWISMGKEFIARTQQMGKILGGFITNTTDIFKDFTKLLGAGLTNLMKFDFLDTSGRVSTAFDELNLSVENWGTDFENAIKLITTPLTEGIASGEDARPLGTENTNEGAYETPAPYSGSGGSTTTYSSTGGQKIAKSQFGRGFGVKDGLGSGKSPTGHTGLDVGMDPGTPLSIVPPGTVHFTATGWNGGYGNLVVIKLDDGRFIKLNHLSKILVTRGEKVGAGSGKDGGVKVVGLVGYTGLTKPAGPDGSHMHIDVGTGFDKNTYYTLGLQDPAPFVIAGGVVRGGNVKATGVVTQTKPPASQPQQNLMGTSLSSSSGGANLSSTQKQALGILSKYESAGAGGYNAVNQIGIRGGRGVMGYSGDFTRMPQHGGRSLTDMTIAEIMALQAKKPGMSNQEWIRQGRLHAVGRYQFIGGTLPGVVKRSGIPINAKFTPEVQDLLALQYLKEAGIGAWIGPSDKATREERMVIERARKEPINYKPPISSGSSTLASATPQSSPTPSTTQSPTPSPAQITPTGTPQNPQISQSLAQERTGPTVIVSQNPSSPAQQMMSSGGGSSGGGSSQISDFALLNNFIKNKLLLDLAYL